LFVDAINVKIRSVQVANRPVYVIMAVTVVLRAAVGGGCDDRT
jgi:hypothetical protein